MKIKAANHCFLKPIKQGVFAQKMGPIKFSLPVGGIGDRTVVIIRLPYPENDEIRSFNFKNEFLDFDQVQKKSIPVKKKSPVKQKMQFCI